MVPTCARPFSPSPSDGIPPSLSVNVCVLFSAFQHSVHLVFGVCVFVCLCAFHGAVGVRLTRVRRCWIFFWGVQTALG